MNTVTAWNENDHVTGFQYVLVETDGPFTPVTLNRPEKRNALALDVMREVTAAFREVAESESLGVILAAAGPVFSAGHNFADMGASLGDARRLFEICTEMMDTVQEIPQRRHPRPFARQGGRVPARRVVRSRDRRGIGGLRDRRRQGRAVLSHAARSSRAHQSTA